MSVTTVVGIQWGDEGKGRIVDYLASQAEMVIRFQGGDNAGHTVINDLGKFGLHIIPSGVFNSETMNIVGAGTVVNFDTMASEIDHIQSVSGRSVDNVFIDRRAHLIMPYHQLLDGAEEGKRSDDQKIGTTKRGIGPCYSDKASRVGLRAGDILDEDWLRKRLELLLPKKNRDLEYYGLRTFTVDELVAKCAAWRERFGSYIIDSQPVVREAVENGRNILLEGQLGIMRDNDWGIYPYSTSSNPTTAGACNGAGIPPRAIDKVVGVIKAYSTSVGGGPYMTELFDEDGEKLRTIGGEFGVTTGRPRRCGWLDLVAADYACYMNGVSDLALTKLDVLDSFEKIRVCTGYMIDGEYYNHLPDTLYQERAKPIYEDFEGWMCDTSKCRRWEELPAKAQSYILEIEKRLGVHITYISVGPERDQLIVR
ncbi:MAG: adenylosuccinate synthase [Spirochaetes bacterium]|uniref:Adenylosuccinate synthetase n=1 Tax=Candidatus Aphodenecus pullistercoris TaxID=2840669 RepID=A0A9D9E7W2_9SPIR|nr:adenylosuccinate synthase [Candidatus Aphodenecus pullistercoris]